MPNLRGMGPACCCCKTDFIRGNETGITLMPGGGLTGTLTYNITGDPAEIREQTNVLNSPGGSSLSYHTIGPDWYSRRLYYAYNTPTMSSVDAIFKWWDVKSTDSSSTAVATVNGYYCDALASHGSDEQLYWAGVAYPYLGTDADLLRMDYDGTNQTNLATVNYYRAGSTFLYGGIYSMLMNRAADRLYYVVSQNVTTASAANRAWDIRYRDLATFTENTAYSVQGFRTGADVGDTYIRLLNCLSFDFTDNKMYWCEHYLAAGGRQEGKVRRANLDGSGVELLYQSADPYAVNFARYSNKLGKIVHGDKDRTKSTGTPGDGVWLRDKASWATEELIALEGRPETNGFDACSSFLWCGYETTGASSPV